MSNKDAKVIACVKSVARSGLSRRIDFYVVSNNDVLFLNADIDALTQHKMCKQTNSVIVKGCGMNMVHHALREYCRKIGLDVNDLFIVNI